MTADLLVIGGGAVGLSIAWKAATAGLKVAVFTDPTRPAASNAAVGGLSFCPAESVLTGNSAVIQLSAEARAGYRQFISSLEKASGVPTLFRHRATLMAVQAGDDASLVDRVEAARRAVGLSSIRLSAAECTSAEPTLAGDVESGLLLEDHDQIDSRALTTSLRVACENSGVVLRAEAVAEILMDAGSATGLRLASGETVFAPKVVVAAGAWSGGLSGLPSELAGAVRPVAGQIVIVKGRPGKPLPRHDLRNNRIYIVTRTDGTIVLGATKEDKGFDHDPTARNVALLLNEAEKLWPGVGDCAWQETVVGMRPHSRDALPLIGATSIPGVIAATGHFRNGIMFAAATADAVLGLVTGGEMPALFDAFSPQREGAVA